MTLIRSRAFCYAQASSSEEDDVPKVTNGGFIDTTGGYRADVSHSSTDDEPPAHDIPGDTATTPRQFTLRSVGGICIGVVAAIAVGAVVVCAVKASRSN